MTRQELFEKHWAEVHDLPVETMQQYRWLHQDGYRLPGIAAAYRNFCAGWDAQTKTIDALLNHCDDGECVTCGQIICPHGDGMHFHHDGCPACAQTEGEHP
jgi:hypothetical protein